MCIQMERSITLTFLEDYFIRSIYYADILIEQEVIKQNEMEELLRDLDAYRPHKLFEGREVINNAFENDIFPLPKRPQSLQGEHEDKDKEFIPQEERPKYN